MRVEFIPIDYDYFDFEDRNYLKIVGRTEKGKKICIVDSYEPNFWIVLKEGTEEKAKKLAERISKIEIKKGQRKSRVVRTEIVDKNFLGKKIKAIRVFVTNHKDLHEIASEIGSSSEIEVRREHDIPLVTKYIKEKGLEPLR